MSSDSLNLQSFNGMNQILFDHLPVGVLYQDSRGRILAANSAAREILGLASDRIPDDFMHAAHWHAIHEDGSIFESQDLPGRQTISTRQTTRDVVIGILKPQTDHYIWINVTSVPQPGVPGESPAIITTIEDITTRKTTEKQLRRITRLYATLSEINQTIVRVKSQQELFEAICKVAIEFGKFDLAWIGLYDPKSGIVTPVGANLPAPFDRLNVNEPPFNETLLGSGLRTGKIAVSNDVNARPIPQVLHRPPPLDQLQSSAIIPIFLKGQILGSLNLYSTSADFFASDEEQNLLEEIGLDISFALDMLEMETRRKLAEEALSASEEALKKSQAAAHVGHWSWDTRTNQLSWSDEMYRIFGYEPGQAPSDLNEVVAQAIHPEDRDMVARSNERVINEQKPAPMEYRVVWPDGSTHNIWAQPGEQIRAETGEIMRLAGIVQDITARKQAEEALRESEQRYRIISDNAADVIWVMDPMSGKFTYVSPSVEKLRGYTPAEVMSQPVNESLTPQSLAEVTQLMTARLPLVIAKGSGTQSFINLVDQPRKDGSIVHTEVTTTYLFNPRGQVEIVGVSRDITERNQAEKALRESEEKFRKAFQTNPDSININRLADGMYVSVNQGFSQIMGYQAEEVIGKTSVELNIWANPVDRKALVDGLTRNGEVRNLEAHFRTKSGAIIDGLMSASVVSLDNIPHIISISRDVTERKNTEERILRLVERFDVASRAAHLGVWDYDIRNNREFWDERMLALYGMKQEDFSGGYADWVNRLHPDDRVLHDEITQRALRGEIEYDTEFRVVWPDGSVHWLKAYGQLIRGADGEPARMIGVNYDISAEKSAAEQIRWQANRLKLLAEASQAFAAAVPDYQSVLESVVQQVVNSLADLAQIRLVSDDGEHLSIAALHSLDPEFSDSLRRVNLRIPIRSDPPPLALQVLRSGEPALVPQISEDLRQAIIPPEYESLGQSRLAHSYILVPLRVGGISIGVLSLTRYRADQPAFSEDDVKLAQDLADRAALAINNARLFQNVQAELAARQQVERDLQLERDSLALRVEKRTAELSLSNAELLRASQAKDEFLSTMSHELRTPLNGVLNLSESLQAGTYGELTPKQISILDTVRESGEHLLALINDVLDVSKAESGHLELQLEAVDLKELIDSALRLVNPQAAKKRLRISFSADSSLGTLTADGRHLKQMLVNLLSNAVKFTPNGGQVGLEVTRETGGDSIRFTAWDTGIGIPADKLQLLFQPFVQLDSALAREYGGSGLGLALVRKMAELHGGSVGVESELGKGSRFWFIIPVIQTIDSEDQPLVPPTAETISAPRRALVIEDSPSAADHIARYLRELNTEVVIRSHGEDAVQTAIQSCPDVILLDLLLPDISGWQVLANLKTNPHTRDIPVVIVSVVDERKRGLAGGAAEYLVKPVTREQLSEVLQKAIAPRSKPSRVLLIRQTDTAVTVQPAKPAGALILFAEDNMVNIEAYMDYLKSIGHRIIPAVNGYEAIERAQEFKPDLILMDIQMPWMDGLEAIRRLRAMPQFAQTPIIALTALAMPGDRERCLAAGANTYLAKPVGLKMLAAEIERLLGGR